MSEVIVVIGAESIGPRLAAGDDGDLEHAGLRTTVACGCRQPDIPGLLRDYPPSRTHRTRRRAW
jgi:hypothetical protein